jgi:lysophospholipase L1-like esterase
MNTLHKTAALLLASLLAAAPLQAAGDEGGWAVSWHASPQPVWGKDFVLPTNAPAWLENQSVRETVRLSAGGKRLKLVFSNRYGAQPLVLGAVTVRPAGFDAAPQAVTFAGRRHAEIAPGAELASDAVALAAPALGQLEVTSYYPRPTPVASFHWGAQQSVQVADGDHSAALRFPPASTVHARLFLNAVQVEAGAGARTVVALGDSITDGNGSTPNADRRWPDYLARRLAPLGIGVANAGISGARLLKDGMGVKAADRLERDVLGQPGASHVIVLLGINDIGWPGSPFAPHEAQARLEDLADGYRALVARAHARGLKVIGATLPPFEGALEGTPYAGHYSPAKEALRQRLNDWIRSSGAFDAVADFDAVLRDPANPRRLLPAYDSGDHLHPGDAGYRAMAESLDLGTLAGR